MRRYETTFIFDPDLAEDGRSQLIEKISGLITKEKGLMVDVDIWGQKKLAYEIRKKTRGFYICVNFCGSAQLVEELERTSRLDDKIMKYMTIVLQDNVNVDEIKAEMDSINEKKTAATEAADDEKASEEQDTDTDEAKDTETTSAKEEE